MQSSVDLGNERLAPAPRRASVSRKNAGRALVALASLGLLLVILLQGLHATGTIATGFSDWRPIMIAYVLWAIAFGIGQIIIRGERGQRALFLLPAVFFTVAVVIFPTIFGIYIASLDWNLSSIDGPRFSGFDNLRGMLSDTYYWNALGNMVFYTVAVLGEYAIAFGLALLLSADIRARKFFRVVFLLPMMLSPVAVSWMVGKSLLEYRFGPAATLARYLGWDNPAFFASPWMARLSIQAMDAWVSIPFIMIILLAGLQAMPKEVQEAAKVDGANGWQSFWHVTFPIMLPVSITVLIIRIIFKLKLADIVINVTAGGPGGATDTVSSFIYRVYRDRSNVGYGTALAMVYLLLIIVLLTVMLRLSKRWTQKVI
ncbi:MULTISPECIES: sugar ABC transporter permease [unclassified Bradyrhizobium]|uniref:carbohydrate ABC transporter permease n=1 Tax=unclassified Bradyrhizobium TaxID=2631580 RepID=UPI002479A89E|nr:MULTISPECIES: sugar ABC transporter permease [unclassified Bradyrhizobium]WGR68689.1 sugar ABC transporter permease [Bradyrhizobium sp. ISRA426]WGR80744.1 sugar ABC transporter permease [Bradyrhizobium sp. ISRA430]WGR83929.1 sugar ABC transporter permease [Bradyrhizobium sp. ISRA432]